MINLLINRYIALRANKSAASIGVWQTESTTVIEDLAGGDFPRLDCSKAEIPSPKKLETELLVGQVQRTKKNLS